MTDSVQTRHECQRREVEEGKKEKTDCNYSRKNDDFLLRTMGGFRDELSC